MNDNINVDERFMQRCIQLARNGQNNVPPNPMVGAVIVCDGRIIGEGYHVKCGCPHAEVNAINSVVDKSILSRATLYVSLEPCSHYGKTPPCADLVLEMQIPRIVVGCQDPFDKVAGRGIQRLRDGGREVIVGVLEDECRRLISHFSVFNLLHRPYIILKWAESADGFIDTKRVGGAPARLSTQLTAMLVHKRRAEAAAVMVGTRTAALDNPQLTVRDWYGNSPLRVVIDKRLVLSQSLHLFDGQEATLVYTFETRPGSKMVEYITLDNQDNLLPQIMADLYARNIQTLLVEGGSRLLQSFIDDGLWDEAYIEKSGKKLLCGVNAPEIRHKNSYGVDIHFGVQIEHFVNRKD